MDDDFGDDGPFDEGAFDGEDEGEPSTDVNYYMVLAVDKEATDEEIKASYRRLCVQFHPDKHQGNPEKKAAAQAQFSRVQRAFEVLSDSQQRTIYDLYGQRGLDAGCELGPHLTTADDIVREFEKLAYKRKMQRMQRISQARGMVVFQVDATNAFAASIPQAQEMRVERMSFQQSVETELSEHDTLTLSGLLVSQDGSGGGTLTAAVKRQIGNASNVAAEVTIGSTTQITGKMYHQFNKHTFITKSVTLHVNEMGARPAGALTVGRQLTKSTMSYVSWKWGGNSGMTVSTVRAFENGVQLTGAFDIAPRKPFSVSSTIAVPVSTVMNARLSGKLTLSGWAVEYGADRLVSEGTRVGLSLALGVPTGVTLKIRVARMGQVYMLPIRLMPDEPTVPSVLLGSAIPALLAYLAHRWIMIPNRRRQERERREAAAKAEREQIALAKAEAESAVGLMAEAVARRIEVEEERSGLVVLAAWYGVLLVNEDDDTDGAGAQHTPTPEVVDVTVPLQMLVRDSVLQLPAGPKSQLVGFYDPMPSRDKQLRVRYKFRERIHDVTIADEQSLAMPRKSHLVK